MNGHTIEQVKNVKYLGVIFHSAGGHRALFNYVTQNAQQSADAIRSFHFTRGALFIPAAIKLFTAKVYLQLLHGAQLGPPFTPLEVVPTTFLRTIFQVPCCVPNTILRREAGVFRLEMRFWLSIFRFWLKLIFAQVGLAPPTLVDSYASKWKVALRYKLQSYGLPQEELIRMGYDQAMRVIKQHVLDIELQEELAKLPRGIYIGNQPLNVRPAEYLNSLTTATFRRAMTLARLNALPTAVLKGKFKKLPYSAHLCPCGSGDIETTAHVILYCTFYKDIHINFISLLLMEFPGHTDDFYLDYLLSSFKETVSSNVAKFCYVVCKTLKELIT
ncbi:uncharacterized protein LOC128342830 [Hemicordylus capensis]|uniref:uncharacterized protein LOC128342830 n=1 Tax=Hemicordylus capensis TaxID=884348 RepID=UPI00230212CB|nr:uncharacterized protein LOC128342830 [Hemicordylus capensis]XP_053146805.1 uncharacterized protein LOC128342830 [Hemicordylus capensis]